MDNIFIYNKKNRLVALTTCAEEVQEVLGKISSYLSDLIGERSKSPVAR